MRGAVQRFMARPGWFGAGLAACILVASGLVWTVLDLDADGLSSYAEWNAGTSPARSDTDEDGLDDGWEVRHGLAPTAADTDDDGLDDADEIEAGSDPRERDSDDDGVTDEEERKLGLDARTSDTDGDTVPDRAELDADMDATDPDSDTDGLDDGEEIELGTDPTDRDTDRDGLSDWTESLADRTDCNRDRVHAALQLDDDSDGRRDSEEPAADRCEPDVDGDGVRDGWEGNEVCIVLEDCDGDGLMDEAEPRQGFDPLDADTHGTGLPDSVSWAFARSGQPPSPDADQDGIPDAWESATGLIAWGDLAPQPGARDLLLEFVRVSGPDSERFYYLDMDSAYRLVANALTSGGLRVTWVETRVRLDAEERPPLLPSYDASYYERVLRASKYAGNPFVTTIVMNPQHDQSELLHLGIAPIRGMLAAVDYGAHTSVRHDIGTTPIELSPFIESIIAGDQRSWIRSLGYVGGGEYTSGEYFLDGGTYTLSWRPLWFATPLSVTVPVNGTPTAFPTTLRGASLDVAETADTILHELGHTLGLCHLWDPTCLAGIPQAEWALVNDSVMGQGKGGPLGFIPSEWTSIGEYLTCPPFAPIGLIVDDASADEVLRAKYAYNLEDIENVQARRCRDLSSFPRTIVPFTEPARPDRDDEERITLEDEPTVYASDDGAAPVPAPDAGRTSAYVGGTVVVAGIAGAAPMVLRRRATKP